MVNGLTLFYGFVPVTKSIFFSMYITQFDVILKMLIQRARTVRIPKNVLCTYTINNLDICVYILKCQSVWQSAHLLCNSESNNYSTNT
jgi:hypothetical protein